MQETWVQSLGREDPLEREMTTHSSILAWEIPWIEEPGGLQPMGSQRIRHDWSDLAQHDGKGWHIQFKDYKYNVIINMFLKMFSEFIYCSMLKLSIFLTTGLPTRTAMLYKPRSLHVYPYGWRPWDCVAMCGSSKVTYIFRIFMDLFLCLLIWKLCNIPL